MRVITNAQLADLRAAYKALIKAQQATQRAGLPGNAIGAEIESITLWDYVVLIPCMFCDAKLPAEVKVEDTNWPHVCICGICSEKIDADIARDAEAVAL